MQTYEQVDNYMRALDLKYYKNTNDFLANLMMKTDKNYVKELAETLNSRAQGQNSDNTYFYKLKNKSLDGSLCVSAAFDSGLFRHLGNMIIDEAQYFNGTVLDIGCDCGMVTCFIAQQYPDCRVVGVDCNELAVNNARGLAQRLGLNNVEFAVADIYDYTLDTKADVVTSFRGLLDIAQRQTSGVSVIGERGARENAYQAAFSPLAKSISNNIADNGIIISIERYTAMYGWLGWMQALAEQNICPIVDKCDKMVAQDISSAKNYSVTFAQKNLTSTPLEAYSNVMVKSFKSGAGCTDADAEFALCYDSDEVDYTDVYKGEKLIHQFAHALSKGGKQMFYEADLDYRKLKYCNEKKSIRAQEDFDRKLAMYNPEEFTVKKYKVKY